MNATIADTERRDTERRDTGHIDIAGSIDDVDRLRLAVLRVARRIRHSAQGDITQSQLAVLATLARRGDLTVGQIAEHEHVQPPSASKIVSALERLGYVERGVDPDDRRCTPITLTADGLAHLDAVRAAGRSWLRSRLDDLDDADVQAIAAAIPALERLLGSSE